MSILISLLMFLWKIGHSSEINFERPLCYSGGKEGNQAKIEWLWIGEEGSEFLNFFAYVIKMTLLKNSFIKQKLSTWETNQYLIWKKCHSFSIIINIIFQLWNNENSENNY